MLYKHANQTNITKITTNLFLHIHHLPSNVGWPTNQSPLKYQPHKKNIRLNDPCIVIVSKIQTF